MTQPPLLDGSYIDPSKICLLTRAIPGVTDAGSRWALYRDEELLSWGWMRY